MAEFDLVFYDFFWGGECDFLTSFEYLLIFGAELQAEISAGRVFFPRSTFGPPPLTEPPSLSYFHI